MTSTEVVKRGNGTVEREWVELMGPALELAKHVVNTEFVPRGLRGNGPGIVAAILYGDELGLGPMQSLAKISVIEGKPTLSAEAQRALILAAGHEIWLDEATTTRVTVSGRRSSSERVSSVTWTLDDAKRANLAGRTNWRMYPRQMLEARATAELARLIFADVIGGLAATEELEDVDPLDAGFSSPSSSPSPTTKRRRRSTKTLATASQTSPEPSRAETAATLPPLPDESAESLLSPEPETPDTDTLDIGGEAINVVDTAAEESEDDETTASTTASSSANSAAVKMPSARQIKALDALVGQLREAEVELEDGTRTRVLSTEQLWVAAANRRGVEVDIMIELLGGKDSDGVLHWSPLRNSLTHAEANDLISTLKARAERWGVK